MAVRRGLLGVELAPVDVAVPHDRTERARVERAGGDVAGVRVPVERVGMREIQVRALVEPVEQRAGEARGREMHLVPSHMGDLQPVGREDGARPLEQAEAADPALPLGLEHGSGGVTAVGAGGLGRHLCRRIGGRRRGSRRGCVRHALVAALEQQLEPQAHAQKRRARAACHSIDDRPVLPRFAHEGDRVVEGPHARQHDPVCRANPLGIVGHLRLGARARQPAGHAGQVALMVVDDDDDRLIGHDRTPSPYP